MFEQYDRSNYGRAARVLDVNALATVSKDHRHPEKTSERYGFIPTATVVDVIKECGLVPVSAREANTRNEANVGYQKHAITFRFAKDTERMLTREEEIAQLMLVNSHMGSASFQLLLSMFRCVCNNQLIVKSSMLVDIRIPHNRYAPEKVAEGIATITHALPGIKDAIERFKAIELNPQEQTAFAEAAIPLRFDQDVHQVMARDVLKTRRYDDTKATLWNTFNVVQENLVKGGVMTTATDELGRRRHARAREVKALDGNLKLNTALWTLTEKMAEIKSAAH